MHSFHFAAFAAIVVVATDPCAGVQAVSIRGDKTVLAKAIAEKLDGQSFDCVEFKEIKNASKAFEYVQANCVGGGRSIVNGCLTCLDEQVSGASTGSTSEENVKWWLNVVALKHMKWLAILKDVDNICTSLGQNFENTGNCVGQDSTRSGHCVVEETNGVRNCVSEYAGNPKEDCPYKYFILSKNDGEGGVTEYQCCAPVKSSNVSRKDKLKFEVKEKKVDMTDFTDADTNAYCEEISAL